MADERVKLGVELDFTSNLSDIQQQLTKALDIIEKNGVELGLNPDTIKKIQNEVKVLANSVTSNFNTTTQKINLGGVRKELNQAGISAASLGKKLEMVGVRGDSAFSTITSSAYTFEKRIKSTNVLLNKFGTVLTNVTAYNAVSGIWNRVVGSIEQAIGFTKDLDRSLNDIRIVSGASADEMERFAKQANESAKALKTSTVEYSDAALVYFQQGMEADDVKKMTDATIMGANIVGESTEEMSELLTAVMNGYKLAADDAITVTDKLAAVGADTAADFYELATGMSKVASMANVAGVDLDSLNAQLATIVSVTKEAPETVGTSLKTIYGRMLAFKNNQTDLMTDDDGQLFDMPSVETALEKYSKATGTQISLFETAEDGTKTMRDLGGVIEDIGDAWDDTSNTAVKFGLATAIAGKLQQNRLVALFDSWDEYKKAVQTSLGAEGTTLEQNAIYMDSYTAHAKEMQASLETLYMTLFQSDDMIGIVDVITDIVNGLTKVTDLLNGLPGILGLIGGVLAKTAFTGQVTAMSKFFVPKAENTITPQQTAATGQSIRYLKIQEEYTKKLSIIQKSYNKEAFEGIRKQVEEYLSLRAELEKVVAQIQLAKEAQANLTKQLKGLNINNALNNWGAVLGENNQVSQVFRTAMTSELDKLQQSFSHLMTDEVVAELNSLKNALSNDQMTVQEFRQSLTNLFNIMADPKGMDAFIAEARKLGLELSGTRGALNGNVDAMVKYSEAVQKVRTVLSTASSMVMSLAFAFDENATATENAKSILTAFGFTLLMQTDIISTKFVPAMAKIVSETETLTLASIKAAGASTVFKGVMAGLGAVFTEVLLPLIAVTAAVAGIIAVVKVIDALIVTTKEQKEKADEATQALEDTTSKIDELTSSIQSLQEQIEELDPLTDSEQIAKLKEQLALTQAQLTAEKELQAIREQQASDEAEKYLNETALAPENGSTKLHNILEKASKKDPNMAANIKYNTGIDNIDSIEAVNTQIDILTDKLETVSLGTLDYRNIKTALDYLKEYRDEYNKTKEDAMSWSQDFLNYYSTVKNPSEDLKEAYQEVISYLNSQDPSTFLNSIFSQEELDQLVEMINSGTGNISSIVNKHIGEIKEAGESLDSVTGYLQTYANQLAKTEEVEQTAEQQFSSIINTIELLGGQLDNGELDVEEYVTNVVANLNKLSNIDLSGVTGANDSLVSVLEDVQSALDVLNSKYASGEMKTEDYNDSVVEIIQQLKTLKTLFPQLSDAIDEMLSKDFNMDKFGVLVAADEVADQWAHVNDVLDSVSDEFSNLATVQEMVADGMTLTYDEVLKLAKLYPELLQNAVVAGNGQMTLNQQVYDQFIKTRQGMLDATIDEQIGELEAQKVVLENKRASLQLELEAVQQFNRGKITLNQLYNKTQQKMEDTLYNYLIQLGVDEANAKDAIEAAMAGDYKEYVDEVGDYADELALQMGYAMADAADGVQNNVKSMITSLQALGTMVNKVAEAIANMPNGEQTDITTPTVSGGGVSPTTGKTKEQMMIDNGVGFSKNATESEKQFVKDFMKNEFNKAATNPVVATKYLPDDFDVNDFNYEEAIDNYFNTLSKQEQQYMLQLEEDLASQVKNINAEIAQLDSAIGVLQASKNYNKTGVFTKEDVKKVQEYVISIKELRKELEALEKIAAKIALLKSMIDSTDDSDTKIALTKQVIELYKEEQQALHATNEAGRKVIKEQLAILSKYGITSSYDASTNSLSINNWEDVNKLVTNEDDRKIVEAAYNTATSVNSENVSRSQQWWTDRSNIQDEFDNWVTYKKEALDKEYAHESKLRDMDLKDFRQYYDKCKAIYDEALAAGYLTAEEYADKLMTLGDDYGDKVKERIDDLIKYGQTTNTLTDDEELGLYEQGKEEILALYKEGKITYAKAKELILDYMDEIADKAEEIFDKSQTEIDRMIAKLETFSGTQLEVLDLYKQKMSEIEQEANAAYASGDMDRFNDLQADYYSTKSALMSATKSMLQTVVDAVVYELDEQIDKLNDEKDALETIYDLQDKLIDLKEEYATADGEDKDFLKEKIDYLEEQIQIYNNLETIEEKMLKAAEIEKELGEITLQQLKQKLELTKKTYTQRVWHEDTGWQWEADPTAVANAEKAVKQQEQNLAVMAIQDEIDALEDYKEKWQEVLEEYEHAQDVMIATAVLGEDWCNAVLSMETGLLDSFASYAVDMCTVVQGAVMSVWETFGSLSTGLEDLALETETATTSARELPDRFYNEDGSWNYNLNLSDEMINDPYGEGYTDYQKELINSIRIEKILNDPTVDQTKYGGDVNWTTYDEASENIKKRGYAAGGVVTETDLAMLHGSPDSPEIVFNAADSKKLYDLVHSSNNLVQDLGVSLPDLLGDITKVTPNFGSIINPSVAGTGLEGSAGSTTNDESMQFSNCSFNFETGADNIGELIQDIKIRIKNR